MKKAEESLSASAMNSSESNLTSSSSSIRRNRILTDTASAPNPTLDTRITSTGASNSSVNTLSTTDGASSASSLPKAKTPAEAVVPITLEYLREHKHFLKLQHKQEKELILIKKKQSKEQTVLCEQQSKLMSKMKHDTDKTVRSPLPPTGNPRKEFRYSIPTSPTLVRCLCSSFLAFSLKLSIVQVLLTTRLTNTIPFSLSHTPDHSLCLCLFISVMAAVQLKDEMIRE